MAPSPRPLDERFWEKVDKRGPDECWEWLAYRDKDGYGGFKYSKHKSSRAHRVAYELAVEPIPDGHEIDHLCSNKACVNPAHLEPVTTWVNLMRSDTLQSRNAQKTHCPHGHPFSGDNLIVTPTQRKCRECLRLAAHRRNERNAEERTCVICKATFSVPSWRKTVTCSSPCAGVFRRGRTRPSSGAGRSFSPVDTLCP